MLVPLTGYAIPDGIPPISQTIWNGASLILVSATGMTILESDGTNKSANLHMSITAVLPWTDTIVLVGTSRGILFLFCTTRMKVIQQIVLTDSPIRWIGREASLLLILVGECSLITLYENGIDAVLHGGEVEHLRDSGCHYELPVGRVSSIVPVLREEVNGWPEPQDTADRVKLIVGGTSPMVSVFTLPPISEALIDPLGLLSNALSNAFSSTVGGWLNRRSQSRSQSQSQLHAQPRTQSPIAPLLTVLPRGHVTSLLELDDSNRTISQIITWKNHFMLFDAQYGRALSFDPVLGIITGQLKGLRGCQVEEREGMLVAFHPKRNYIDIISTEGVCLERIELTDITCLCPSNPLLLIRKQQWDKRLSGVYEVGPSAGSVLNQKHRSSQRYRSSQRQQTSYHENDPFPKDFEPIKAGDERLAQLVRKYILLTYPTGPQEFRPLQALLTNEANEAPFQARTVPLRWSPVECKTTSLSLRKVGTINKGSRNLVLKMYDQVGKQLFAWKCYANTDEYTSEVALLTATDHPNIVRAVCVQRDGKTGRPGLLIEYVAGGKSMDYAKKNANNPAALQKLCAQLYDVLKYIHWLGYIHADFKPENVMIDRDGNAVAIDFGFSIPKPYFKYYRGTPPTVALELVKAVPGPIQENIDTWALVSTILQLYGASVMPTSTSRTKRGHKWAPVRISKRHGFLFGEVPHKLSKPLRQLLFFGMHYNPLLRMLNTPSQLAWFESLPIWRGIDFNTIGYDWLSPSTHICTHMVLLVSIPPAWR
ncbi:putative kinase [Paramicrosporidium saccamoebae]|uniref:Putative kinase n=1 Tax=Paramicrosporidium saccamoebae TaxID=1246581 RepID=A0A2H9TKF4_9FUNG|nr:putative kinase [Paramicrosporidium saccamoebae]